VSSSLRTFHATACSYDTGRPMLDTQTPPGRYAKPCCIILGYSVQSAFRPSSSRIFSSEMSWRAIRVVSSMSRPAWLAKVNTGAAFREQHMIESECCQSAFRKHPCIGCQHEVVQLQCGTCSSCRSTLQACVPQEIQEFASFQAVHQDGRELLPWPPSALMPPQS